MGHWEKTIRDAMWVSIVALVLAGSAYMLRPHKLPLVPPAEDEAIMDAAEGGIAFIGLEDAIRHFEQGTAVFADARSLPAFEAGHIRGALHLAPQEFDLWSSQVFSEIAVDQMIITYCDGAQCALGHELAEKFAWLGYENVVILKDGWSRWRSSNMPVGNLAD